MAVDTLVTAADLVGFWGAPFDDALVEVAQESVRGEAGWHIAPVRTETLHLSGNGSTYLIIPSRRIISIDAVRYGPGLTELTSGWTIARGGLYLPGGWPWGPVEVDIVHGYPATPLDLLPVIAARVASGVAGREVSAVTSGAHQVQFAAAAGAMWQDNVIDRYQLLGPT